MRKNDRSMMTDACLLTLDTHFNIWEDFATFFFLLKDLHRILLKKHCSLRALIVVFIIQYVSVMILQDQSVGSVTVEETIKRMLCGKVSDCYINANLISCIWLSVSRGWGWGSFKYQRVKTHSGCQWRLLVDIYIYYLYIYIYIYIYLCIYRIICIRCRYSI